MDFVVVPIFALHLVCVNLAAGGPLVAIWLSWQASGGHEAAVSAGKWLAGLSFAGLIAGGMLGIALGALLWSPQSAGDIWRRLDSRAVFGVWEIVFSLALHAGYWAWWVWGPLSQGWQQWTHRGLALLSTTNLLYHFPPLFAVAGQMARGELAGSEPLTSAEFRGLLMSGPVLSQTVHFLLASIAVSGVAVLYWAAQNSAVDEQDNEEQRLVTRTLARHGAWIALVPTLLQIIIGLWVLTSLPITAQYAMIGVEPLRTVLFALSMAAVLGLIHDLWAATMSDTPAEHGRSSVVWMGAVIVLMTAVLHFSRISH
jgi:hypothetical protein